MCIFGYSFLKPEKTVHHRSLGVILWGSGWQFQRPPSLDPPTPPPSVSQLGMTSNVITRACQCMRITSCSLLCFWRFFFFCSVKRQSGKSVPASACWLRWPRRCETEVPGSHTTAGQRQRPHFDVSRRLCKCNAIVLFFPPLNTVLFQCPQLYLHLLSDWKKIKILLMV